MVIHPDKTKCMVVTTRQKHHIQELNLQIKLGTTTIEQVKCHKMLGVLIDHELNWNTILDP